MLGSATKLKTVRKINGTNFDGSQDINTSKWGTSRKITISGAVSGNANVDGSGDVTINVSQSNIAVLTGNVSISNGSGYTELNYPNGYTKDNCVAIASGLNMGNYYEFNHVDGLMLVGTRLTATKVIFRVSSVQDISSSGTKGFKIVLMKIS